jgi:hypothetical protein
MSTDLISPVYKTGILTNGRMVFLFYFMIWNDHKIYTPYEYCPRLSGL